MDQGFDAQHPPLDHAAVPADRPQDPPPPTPPGETQQHVSRDGKIMTPSDVAPSSSGRGDGDGGHLSAGLSENSTRSGPTGSGSNSGSALGSKSNTSLELTPATSLQDEEFFPLTTQNIALANTNNLIAGLRAEPDSLPEVIASLEKKARKLRVADPSPTRADRPSMPSNPSYNFSSQVTNDRRALDSIVKSTPFNLPTTIPPRPRRNSSQATVGPNTTAAGKIGTTPPGVRPPGSPTFSGTSGWSGSSAKAAEATDILSPLPTPRGSSRDSARPQLGRLASVPVAPTIHEVEVIMPSSPAQLEVPQLPSPGLASLMQSPLAFEDEETKSRSTASDTSLRRTKSGSRRPLADSPFRSFHGSLPSSSATTVKHSPAIFPALQSPNPGSRPQHRRVTSTDQESLLSAGRTPQVNSPDLEYRQPFFHNFHAASSLSAAPEPSSNKAPSPQVSECGSTRSTGSSAPFSRIRNAGVLAPHGSFTTAKVQRASSGRSNSNTVSTRKAESESSGSSRYDTPKNGSIGSLQPTQAIPPAEMPNATAIAAAAGDQIALEELKRESRQFGFPATRTPTMSFANVTSWGLSGSRTSIRRASDDSASSHPTPTLGSSSKGPLESSVSHDSGDVLGGAVRLGLGIIAPVTRTRTSGGSDLFMDAAMLASRQSALDNARANKTERERRESDARPQAVIRRSTSQSKSPYISQGASSSTHTEETDEQRRERRQRRSERKERRERRERKAAERAEQAKREGVLQWADTVAGGTSAERSVPAIHFNYPPASLDDSLESVEEVEREEQARRDKVKARRQSAGRA